MQYLGLIFEIIILIAAIYAYLFTRGHFSSKDPQMKQKADAFRKENKGWMRIGSLLVIALMSIEIYLNIKSLIS